MSQFGFVPETLRFTAGYITELLCNGLESPHRTLTQFINRMTNFTPSDADDIEEREIFPRVIASRTGQGMLMSIH